MWYFTVVLATGLLLGMRHATDPDHVVAVTAIISRERSLWRAGGVGLLWGAGHGATILLVGGAIAVFGLVLPSRVNDAFELGVAVLLIVVGARNLVDAHSHAALRIPLPPFFVGVVHGLAGSAAAALLLVPLIADVHLAALYLIVFGAGTLVGMMVLTCAIAASTLYAARRVRGLNRWIQAGAGATSAILGALLIYRIA
jgi:high-affinity nickel-transport protein